MIEHIELDARHATLHAEFLGRLRDIEKLTDLLEDSRSRAIATTKLEEAAMWLGKAVAESQMKKSLQGQGGCDSQLKERVSEWGKGW